MAGYNCILCGSENHKVIKRGLQYQEPGTVVLCMNCGLVFLRDRMSELDCKSYYSKDYWGIYSDQSTLPQPQNIESQKARGRYIFEFIQDYLNSQNSAKLLEIGCGGGGILAQIREICNVKCYGIEPDQEFSKYARDVYGLDVRTGFFEDNIFKGEVFDFVILSHVLEHFMNPLEALNRLSVMMKGSHKLFIEVPNILNIPITTGLTYFFKKSHVFYFSPVTLDVCLKYCGFKPIKWGESPKGGMMVLCEKQDLQQYSSLYRRIDVSETERILQYLRKYKSRYYLYLLTNPRRLSRNILVKMLTILNLDNEVRQVYRKMKRIFRIYLKTNNHIE